MKMQNVIICNKPVTQIFIGRQEANKEEIREEIKLLQEQKNRIVVFVEGQNEIKPSLQEVIQIAAIER